MYGGEIGTVLIHDVKLNPVDLSVGFKSKAVLTYSSFAFGNSSIWFQDSDVACSSIEPKLSGYSYSNSSFVQPSGVGVPVDFTNSFNGKLFLSTFRLCAKKHTNNVTTAIYDFSNVIVRPYANAPQTNIFEPVSNQTIMLTNTGWMKKGITKVTFRKNGESCVTNGLAWQLFTGDAEISAFIFNFSTFSYGDKLDLCVQTDTESVSETNTYKDPGFIVQILDTTLKIKDDRVLVAHNFS
jgi:hypothetical protein